LFPFSFHRMRVIIRENYENVSDYVAEYVKYRINQFKPTADHPFVLGLPTGSTPIALYKRLVSFVKKGELSFQNVITFNMDEYVGLPEEHPQSYHYFMKSNLFDHIDIKPQNIHILNGNAKDLHEECINYEKSIQSYGGIHLFLGGVGVDGHIAFNEPSTSLKSRTHIQCLTEETVQSNARFFGGSMDQVPKRAVTVGVGTIMDSKEVLIMVSGMVKAIALREAIEGSVNHMFTISALQMHENSIIVCDEDSTNELKVKTVKYFKHIEKNDKFFK